MALIDTIDHFSEQASLCQIHSIEKIGMQTEALFYLDVSRLSRVIRHLFSALKG